MIERLDYDHYGQGRTFEQAKTELDVSLGVSMWWTPFGDPLPSAPIEQIEEGAPWWWRGDEEASQSFLQAMGVTPGA